MSIPPLAVFVDGRSAEADDLVPFALGNDGHFTAMQVRDGRVRGIELHLERLRSAHARLYGIDLDTARVRALMRHAVAEHPNAYLRVTITQASGRKAQVLAVVRAAVDAGDTPAALQTVPWTRSFAEIKHVGTFPQIQHARDAERAGFDDALFVTADGLVAETTIANIAFVRDREVLWPTAPTRPGITQRLLAPALAAHGYSSVDAPVRLSDAAQLDAAVLTNSTGLAPVGRIDSHTFEGSVAAARALDDLYRAVPAHLL